MKYNFNVYVSLIALAFGVYGFVIRDLYVALYGMLVAIFLVLWTIMGRMQERVK